MKKYENILIDVRGGTGKNVALASILNEVKEHYRIVSVISPYYDIFKACPFCDYAYKPEQYKSALEDAGDDTYIAIDHIYDTDAFIRKEISYADAFRRLCLIPEKNDKEHGMNIKSNLNTKRVADFSVILKQFLDKIHEAGKEDFIIFQHTGGQTPLISLQAPKDANGNVDWAKIPYTGADNGLSRHYPTEKASRFVELFKKAHPKTAVVSYTLPNEPVAEGSIRFIMPYLSYIDVAKLPECKGIVTIDSSLQHLTAGLTRTVVMWHHTLPQSFGYAYNLNLVAKCKREGIKYFSALGASGNRIEYIEPVVLLDYVEKCLFKHDFDNTPTMIEF